MMMKASTSTTRSELFAKQLRNVTIRKTKNIIEIKCDLFRFKKRKTKLV